MGASRYWKVENCGVVGIVCLLFEAPWLAPPGCLETRSYYKTFLVFLFYIYLLSSSSVFVCFLFGYPCFPWVSFLVSVVDTVSLENH